MTFLFFYCGLVCLKIAKQVAVEAGNTLFMPNYVKSIQDKRVDIKDGNTANLVTATDKAIQEFIQERLSRAFPSHKFMGEESEAADVDEIGLGDEPTWIVDPIDGTTNFVHQFRMTVISIGLSVDKRPVVGVIYCPFTDELYEAVVGGGAQCNGRPLKINAAGLDLTSSLVITEFGATGSGTIDAVQARMNQLSRLVSHGVHGIRMLGSAAFNLTQVANGSAQVYFETGIHAWDITAGVLIVHEAGGLVREFVPSGEFRLNGRSLIAAANDRIMSELVQVLELK